MKTITNTSILFLWKNMCLYQDHDKDISSEQLSGYEFLQFKDVLGQTGFHFWSTYSGFE